MKSPLTFREMLSRGKAKFFKWLSGQAAQKIEITKYAAECLFTEMPAKNLFMTKVSAATVVMLNPLIGLMRKCWISKSAGLTCLY